MSKEPIIIPLSMEEERLIEKYKSKHWIKEGMRVVHLTSLNYAYTVSSIARKSKEIFCDKDDKGAYWNDDEKAYMKRKSFIIGVDVRMIDNEGRKCEERFHSKELAPYELAMEGGLGLIQKWIQTKDRYNGST